MQAAVYHGKETIRVQDWPDPELSAGEVLIKVRYAGICGTDMMIYSGKHPRATPPRVLGHEIFGTITELGRQVDPLWNKGTRVAVYPLISCMQCTPCREGNAHVCEKLGLIGIDRDGGFAVHVKARQDQLVLVPDEVNDEQAAVVEPLSVAVHAVGNSSFRPGDTVLVTGGGPIGNLLAQVLRASGAREVIVSETKQLRRELARRMGFLTCDPTEGNALEALRRLTGEHFVDCVFEASGFAAAYRDAVQCCKVRGAITFVGIPKAPPELDILSIVFKEIQAHSARVYKVRDFRAALALLARRAVDVLPIITDRLPLRDAPLGFQKMYQADTSLKILFAP
jgi:(R,R)-butanediol dehydrogenase / meso-butanediol dehydrogenase / diacetyl reductase